jgi:hypothetical protein
LPDLPELREHIRARRAALAGFMEQGASLSLDGDLLRVIPRNDIYIRYLNDNRASICELAIELYGRKLRVEVSVNGAGEAAISGAVSAQPMAASPSGPFGAVAVATVDRAKDGATRSGAPLPAVEQSIMPAADSATAADSPLPQAQARSLAADRQALYADPVVRCIFEEFHGRLVEVREVRERPAAAPSTSSAEAPAVLSASASNDSAPPTMRRRPQE